MITVRMEIFSFGRTISSAPQHNGALITIKPRMRTPGNKQVTIHLDQALGSSRDRSVSKNRSITTL